MNEGELGCREAANPDTWVTVESVLSVLPPGFVVCVLSDTPPPTHAFRVPPSPPVPCSVGDLLALCELSVWRWH